MTTRTRAPLEDTMPVAVDKRHHALNVAARECYWLRNTAKLAGDTNRAEAFEDIGNVYFERALALTAEWEE